MDSSVETVLQDDGVFDVETMQILYEMPKPVAINPVTGREMPKEKWPKFVCSDCKEVFSGENTFLRHQSAHRVLDEFTRRTVRKPLPTNPLMTEKFKKMVRLSNSADVHVPVVLRNDGKLSFVCRVCDKSFDRKKYFARHWKRHTNAFQCRICEQAFGEAWRLRAHVLKNHDNVNELECKNCKRKLFVDGWQCHQHMQKCHKDGALFENSADPAANRTLICHVCNVRLTTIWGYRSHLALHKPWMAKQFENGKPKQSVR